MRYFKNDINILPCVDAKCGVGRYKMFKTSYESVTGIVRFKGTRVSFYKRAQILVADLWGIMEARVEGHAISIDWLTMFADYRVPQALVYLGALRYSDVLMQALKNGEKAGVWTSFR